MITLDALTSDLWCIIWWPVNYVLHNKINWGLLLWY